MKTLVYFLFMIFMSVAAAAQTGSTYVKQIDGSIIQRNTTTGLTEFTYRESVDGSVNVYDSRGVQIGIYRRDVMGNMVFYPF
jgi:hypothetical protein